MKLNLYKDGINIMTLNDPTISRAKISADIAASIIGERSLMLSNTKSQSTFIIPYRLLRECLIDIGGNA